MLILIVALGGAAAAFDTIKTSKGQIYGEIVGMDATKVEIRPTTGNKLVKQIPVNEIEGISYEGEIPDLKAAKFHVQNGRYAEALAGLPHLDFLDVGWGGDVAALRAKLPRTFLNLRLSPVEIVDWSPARIHAIVTKLVRASGDPLLTGVCCINMDDRVGDDKIRAIFEAVSELRKEFQPAAL